MASDFSALFVAAGIAAVLAAVVGVDCAAAQTPELETIDPSGPEPLRAERVAVRALGDNDRVERVRAGGHVVAWHEDGHFTLRDLAAGTSTELPFTSPSTRYTLTMDERHIYFAHPENPELVIYELETGKTQTLSHPQGTVLTASISGRGDTVFQVRPTRGTRGCICSERMRSRSVP